ncbi:MAG TPA: acyl-CoA dehydrogenase family protein [Acidimicrobiales bacterium]
MAELSEAELRRRVRQLLDDVDVNDRVAFRGAQFDRGLAWVHFPEGKGGLGQPRHAQTIINDELRKAPKYYDDLGVNPIGIGMAAPVLLAYASDELQDRFLRRIFTGEEIWCQLFSEPGAGSDVATLATRAVRDGDEWVVNGQKVWTTLAHVAKWGLLLARTDPDQPKHKGLTYFVLDMHAPGVEVRPLFQITGEAEFNEVFFTDARVPDSHRLGGVGEGWNVAITTLMNERVALGGGVPAKGSGAIQLLMDLWRKRPSQGDPLDKAMRDRVVQLWIRAEVLRLTNLRARAAASSGTPGPEGSVGKLMAAELNKAIGECAVDLLGPAGMLHPAGYPMVRPDRASLTVPDPTKRFLRMRANSIEGGTSEVMRNILGERVLGLPKEPAVDRDVPWSQIPRSA